MKKDIANIVTDKIIKSMETGMVPWRQPWNDSFTTPTSLATGKKYRGINNLILTMVGQIEGYETGLWGTYKQFAGMEPRSCANGSVTKDESGTPVILWKPIKKMNADGEEESFMLMRYFTVFNIAQTNVEIPEKYKKIERKPVPVLEGLKTAMNYPNGPKIAHLEQDKAFYVPSLDEITLPNVDQFKSSTDYAQTVLHEIAHSTGHETRLKRDLKNGFGCAGYAAEELVAEIGSAMLANELNIDVDWDQSAAYVGSWLKALKDDRKMIITAAQRAQKIIDHVLPEDSADTVAGAA